MEITSGTGFFEIGKVSYPVGNYTVHSKKKYVMIMPLVGAKYIIIKVEGTTLNGAPATSLSEIYTFLKTIIF